jgi:hypothetical protein
VTHIHGKHGHHHVSGAHKAGGAKPAGEQPAPAKAAEPKMHHDKHEVDFASASARAEAQKKALARHSHSDVHDFDKAFDMQAFSEARREKAAIKDAVKVDPPKTYEVVAEDARVRTHPMGLVTANVKQGDRFVVEATKTDKHGNTWAWGYALGEAKKPGWMPIKAGSTHVLKETDEKLPKGYQHAGEPVNQAKLWNLKYVTGKEKKHGADYTLRFTVKDTHQNAKLYENVDSHGHVHGVMQKLKPGDVVRIRYSLDGKTAMVQRSSKNDDDPHSKWAYAKISDLQYAPLEEKHK